MLNKLKIKRGSMTASISTQGIVLVIIASTIMAVSSLMLRHSIGVVGGFGSSAEGLIGDISKLLLQPVFVIGVFLYAGATLLWMKVMSTEPISIGYPILVATSFVVIGTGAAYFFGESLSVPKLVGMAVIIVGVIIASFG
jgi:multidrug transporter EmrE-like cation transporter